MKLKQALILAFVSGVGIMSPAATTFDASQAFQANMTSPGPAAVFTDAQGGRWRIGMMTQVANSPLVPFEQTFVDNGGAFLALCNSSGKLDPPYCCVNAGTEPLTHGGDTGNMGYELRPGELLIHPNNPPNSGYCVTAIEFIVPEAGFYSARATARDICTGDDGVGVSILVNGVGVVGGNLKAPDDATEITLTTDTFTLNEGDVIRLVVDPCSSYSCDSTVCTLVIEEIVGGDDVISFADLMREAVTSTDPLQPLVRDGYAFSCGTHGPRGENVAPFPFVGEQLSPTAKGYFAGEGYPYALVNHTDVSSPLTVAGTRELRPGEMLLHPSPEASAWVGVTVPADGMYRVAAFFKDLGVVQYATSLPGALGQIRLNHTNLVVGVPVSYENQVEGRFVESPVLSLKAGDVVSVAVDSQGGDNMADLTAVQALLISETAVAYAPEQIVNVDIDGYQANDEMPTTFTGRGLHLGAGEFWNSLSGADQAVSTLFKDGLRTSNGKLSALRARLSAEDGLLGFDRESGGFSSLLDDYLYAYENPVTLSIEGLKPQARYDLCLYNALKTTALNVRCSRFTVNGVTKAPYAQGEQVLECGVCAAVFTEVPADDEGRIAVTVWSSAGEGAVLLNGFQVAGPIPLAPSMTIILVR